LPACAPAGRCAAEILDALVPHVVPGVTTQEIDDIVFAEMRRRGASGDARLSRLHQELLHLDQPCRVHGIPSDRVLKDGDIINIDVTPILDGWHGDTSRMFLVGDVGIKARRLVDITYECLMLGWSRRGPAITRATSAPRSSARRGPPLFGGARFCGHGPGPAVPRRARGDPRAQPGTGPS
jgi:methionyl aminopeptidase